MDRLAMHPVALVVMDLRDRRVDGDLMEIGSAQPGDLRVHVRMDASREQRVVAEVDTRHDVRRAEGHLLGFGKEVIRIAIQHEPSDRHDRHELLGHELRCVEDVEGKGLGLFLGENLQAQLPFRIGARLNRLPEVAPMEIGIGAGDLHGFIPHQRVGAGLRRPMELDEARGALRVDQAERMHAETLHRPIAARDRAIGHRPHQHVGDLWHQ
jgi:hypothetical protein